MTGPIVVGVDGSPSALEAVSWAGAEAVLREAPLRIAYAALRWNADMPFIPQPPSWDENARAAALRMLRQAAGHARAGCSRLEVTTEILDGGAGDALVAAAREARLLVVGNRGRGGFAELLLGSVSRAVISRAPCPVAVVRRSDTGGRGDIVVGVTGGPDQEPVLEFAFREAGLRGVSLRALHAWRHPSRTIPWDERPLVYDVEEVGREEERLVAAALAGWRERFPDVRVTWRVVHEHPARALAAASAETDLVIIGAHTGPGGLPGLGATAHAVVHHARAPVVVVRR
ncbi:universal stress protein [Spongiactinospora sp. TRM90649]|uniref:universal stress protein n=1 Tax=Spongiactinospora sp. TRM90649 TaxID=3031114 RepID=UPI0023F7B258|nr:universal stress protein [Spongiactinospora sp. TRM90649]MDF5756295.1 universal stress protein [Spongiactinospora sp. TRM90649]